MSIRRFRLRAPDPVGPGAAGNDARVGEEARWIRIGWPVALGVMIVLSAYWIGGFYLWPDGGNLFLDAHIYFQATQAWLDGGNPWTATYRGVPFAGIPPTLLLNLPLVPFGETAAVGFWAVANTLSVAYIVRRLALPLWTVLLLPVTEGWLAASPDLTLAGLVVAGGGWFAALTKPYSAPVLLADRRWWQLSAAIAVGLVTIPLLPWGLFYESREIVLESFAAFAGNPVSASGNPLLQVAVALALISLGWRRGLILLAPGLLAQQPHYLVFSMEAVRWSRALTLSMTTPAAGAVAVGVLLYAVLRRVPGIESVDLMIPLADGPRRVPPSERSQ